jgi:hypothetical protein
MTSAESVVGLPRGMLDRCLHLRFFLLCRLVFNRSNTSLLLLELLRSLFLQLPLLLFFHEHFLEHFIALFFHFEQGLFPLFELFKLCLLLTIDFTSLLLPFVGLLLHQHLLLSVDYLAEQFIVNDLNHMYNYPLIGIAMSKLADFLVYCIDLSAKLVGYCLHFSLLSLLRI